MGVEPRGDAEVEAQREKLLKRVNGFSEFDDHLKSFFNSDIPNGAEKMGREYTYAVPLQPLWRRRAQLVSLLQFVCFVL